MKEKKKIVTVRLPLDDYKEIADITFALHRMVPGMIRFMLLTWPAVMADHCKLCGLEAIPKWMERLAGEIYQDRKETKEVKEVRKDTGKILLFPV